MSFTIRSAVLLLSVISLLLMGCDRVDGPAASQEFAAGQVWTYTTRAGEEASRITVCRVETHPKLGAIVHIQVDGVRVGNRPTFGPLTYDAAALRECVTTLQSRAAPVPPGFVEWHLNWRVAADEEKAGASTRPVSETITALESAMNECQG